jgi:PelA/Pel-15E family pectate lyase
MSLFERTTHKVFRKSIVCAFILLLISPPTVGAQPFRSRYGGIPIARLTDQPDNWFNSPEGKRTAENILSWQNANGGWWKNYNTSTTKPTTVPSDPKSGPPGDDDDVWHRVSTIDNDATYSELLVMARAYRVLKDEKYKDSFNKGLHYLFGAQYPNGGWPQRFPLQNNYGRHITFNDGAMLGVMNLLWDVADDEPDFTFVSDADRKEARQRLDKGFECILNCQVKINGKLTVWCQQHDEVTLAPAGARAYELPSLTASESTGLTLLLMQIDKPDARVRDAVDSAVAWLQANKITGKRINRVSGQQYENGREVVVVDDPKADPIWARFYDLDTGKPFFCSRDGIKRNSIDQISHERRVNYAWYGIWPNRLLQEYPAWKDRVSKQPISPTESSLKRD